MLPQGSSNLPEYRTGSPYSLWSCFGWGLHGLICYHTSGSLLHHLFTLTFRRLFSVALSLESPPPDVIRHPAL